MVFWVYSILLVQPLIIVACRAASSNPTFPCLMPGCPEVYTDILSLSTHIHIKHPEVRKPHSYTCHVCGKEYLIENLLLKHIQLKHDEEAFRTHFTLHVPKDGEMRCPVHDCRRTYSKRTHLLDHIQSYHPCDTESFDAAMKIGRRPLLIQSQGEPAMVPSQYMTTAESVCGTRVVRTVPVPPAPNVASVLPKQRLAPVASAAPRQSVVPILMNKRPPGLPRQNMVSVLPRQSTASHEFGLPELNVPKQRVAPVTPVQNVASAAPKRSVLSILGNKRTQVLRGQNVVSVLPRQSTASHEISLPELNVPKQRLAPVTPVQNVASAAPKRSLVSILTNKRPPGLPGQNVVSVLPRQSTESHEMGLPELNVPKQRLAPVTPVQNVASVAPTRSVVSILKNKRPLVLRGQNVVSVLPRQSTASHKSDMPQLNVGAVIRDMQSNRVSLPNTERGSYYVGGAASTAQDFGDQLARDSRHSQATCTCTIVPGACPTCVQNQGISRDCQVDVIGNVDDQSRGSAPRRMRSFETSSSQSSRNYCKSQATCTCTVVPGACLACVQNKGIRKDRHVDVIGSMDDQSHGSAPKRMRSIEMSSNQETSVESQLRATQEQYPMRANDLWENYDLPSDFFSVGSLPPSQLQDISHESGDPRGSQLFYPRADDASSIMPLQLDASATDNSRQNPTEFVNAASNVSEDDSWITSFLENGDLSGVGDIDPLANLSSGSPLKPDVSLINDYLEDKSDIFLEKHQSDLKR